MWGRKKRDKHAGDDGASLEPEQSYWTTHADPAAGPTAPPVAGQPGPAAGDGPISGTVITVNGQPVDLGSGDAHQVFTMLAQHGKLTETHVFETTKHATPEQGEQIAQLLEQRRSGAISDPDFAAQVLRVLGR